MYCITCEKKVTNISKEGVCSDCLDKEDIADVIQIKLPGGIVAFWIASSAYMNKERNQRYFGIPDKMKKMIIHGKDYKIVIQEL